MSNQSSDELVHAALRTLKLKGEAVLQVQTGSEGALSEVLQALNASVQHTADVSVLREPSPGAADVLVRNRDELREIRVCVIGNVRAPLRALLALAGLLCHKANTSRLLFLTSTTLAVSGGRGEGSSTSMLAHCCCRSCFPPPHRACVCLTPSCCGAHCRALWSAYSPEESLTTDVVLLVAGYFDTRTRSRQGARAA